MLSYKKPLIDKFLEPLIKPLSGVDPNVLTLLGSIPSLLFFVFIINKWYLLALIAFLGTAFDAIDGMVARKYGKVTKFGGFLDSTFDRVSDFLIISAFGFGGIVKWEIVAPVILASFLISYIRARAESAKPDISFKGSLMERTERLLVIALALLTYVALPETLIGGFNIAEVIFLILLALSFYTVIQRLVFAYKHL